MKRAIRNGHSPRDWGAGRFEAQFLLLVAEGDGAGSPINIRIVLLEPIQAEDSVILFNIDQAKSQLVSVGANLDLGRENSVAFEGVTLRILNEVWCW